MPHHVIVAANLPQNPIAVLAIVALAALIYVLFLGGRAVWRWMRSGK